MHEASLEHAADPSVPAGPVVLVDPADHVRHLNQVAEVSPSEIVVLRRKFVSRAGYEAERHPLADCTRIQYFDERPLLTVLSGVLILAVVVGTLALLVLNWNALDAGTRVPVGALSLAGLYGAARTFGARRHRLALRLKDGRELGWRSRPGQYAQRKGTVERVLALARSRGIAGGGSLVRG